MQGIVVVQNGEGGIVLVARIKRVCGQRLTLCPPLSARSRCLGFTPREKSFAFEPAVQLRSISSLSGGVNKNGKINIPYLPPYVNPLEPDQAPLGGSHPYHHIILTLLKNGEGGIVLVARIKRVCGQRLTLCPPLSARSRCLGFTPREKSFAFEPAVQLRSISSLSGGVNKNGKINIPYLPPYVNPLEPDQAPLGGSHPYHHIILTLLKNGEGGIRTRGGISPSQIFEICTLNHSDTSPSILFYKHLPISNS